MGQLDALTGCDFSYDYQAITELYDLKDIEAYCRDSRSRFANIAKSFNDELNTEWLIRAYLSLKYILAATVLISSAKHAESQNIKVTVPYLKYYTLFNCCRALNLTFPDYVWRGPGSIEASHGKVVNFAANALRRIDLNSEKRWGDFVRKARDHRELFSYSFPALGRFLIKEKEQPLADVAQAAQFFAEMAQLNSECLYSAIKKHSPGPHGLIESEDLWRTMKYQTEDEKFIDDDDWHRIGQAARQNFTPVPLTLLASEGLVEDFFGAWASEDEIGYNPDDHWGELLDFG